MKKLKNVIILLALLISQLAGYAQVNTSTVAFKGISKKESRFLLKKIGDFIQEEPDSVDTATVEHFIALKKFVASASLTTTTFTTVPAPFVRYMLRNVYRNDIVNYRVGKNTGSTSKMQQDMIDRMVEEKNKEQAKEESQKSIQCQILTSLNLPCPYK